MPRPRPLVRTALLGLLALGAACGGPPTAGRPNVLVVVIDTLRADHLPFYGYPTNTAPFLSELAERGVVFERAWSTSSWTAPATASIFTGLYPNQHGVTQGMKLVRSVQRDKQPTLSLNRIPAAIETMPEFFRRLGYRTFGITDNPNICAEEGFDAGFDRFENFDDRNAPAVNRTLAGWAEEIGEREPWFVYLHYMDPHYPYIPREPWYVDPVADVEASGRALTREEGIRRLHAVYDSEIHYVDDFIRRAYSMLGADEETVVVVVADHGEELMQRSDDLQHEFKLYSELTHVPLVVVHPGAELARSRVPHTVSIVDVLPTLKEIVGAPDPDPGEARSLVPYYTAPEPPRDDRPVFSMRERLEVLGGQKKWAVIRRDDKLILTENDRGGGVELYDLGDDWGELVDLSETDVVRVAELRGGLADFRERAAGYEPESIEREVSDEEAAMLEQLGYAGDEPEPDDAE